MSCLPFRQGLSQLFPFQAYVKEKSFPRSLFQIHRWNQTVPKFSKEAL